VTLQVPGKVVFDLAGVEQINSCGVREWIYFTRNLAEVDRGFELARCSPAVVRQLNTISNFRGNGSVRSVMLPYYCAGCRREEYTFLDLSGEGDREIAEEIPCPRCGKAMEFDDIPDTYLSFAG
jgi:DNA-directed RNA polymerase subunit RPC12/RpoP